MTTHILRLERDTQTVQPGLHRLHAAAVRGWPAAELRPGDRALAGKAVESPADAALAGARASLDAIVAAGHGQPPQRVVMFASPQRRGPRLWYVALTTSLEPTTGIRHFAVDGRTAQVLAEPRVPVEGKKTEQPKVHRRAAPSVPHRAVSEILTEASKASLSKVRFISEPEN